LIYNKIHSALNELTQRPSYGMYLRDKVLRATGYDTTQWIRAVYSREWQAFLSTLPLDSLSVLEISPSQWPVIKKNRVAHYRAVNFPEFDITKDSLTEKFDIIIAEQVFEHLRHPYRAARNVHEMLRDDGIFLISTPFMVKIHAHPYDYTRWTPDGLRAFLEDCGFFAEVYAWGNRKAIVANFNRWRRFGWKRDLRNEADFPASVWAYARKQPASCRTT